MHKHIFNIMNQKIISSEYKNWINGLKLRIRQSQIKASIKVNSELLHLYWQMGKDITEKQLESTWGSGFFNQLSKDLKEEFPHISGFSPTNLKYIKRFYLFYNQPNTIRQQVADELNDLIFKLPWFHHVYIITKCKCINEALFYIQRSVENGWSRAILEHHIDLDLYNREGCSITNFNNTLPAPQSDLAKQVTKDPYIFDFLSITDKHTERELEDLLSANMTQFLMELGSGFCYYGKQVHIQVGEDDFYIDLLFYHVKLHCYVVVELKTTKFKPEHIGQLKFYVTAIDKQLKSENDAPTIGLLICKDKNEIVAEYTLSDIEIPIGISSYEVYNNLSSGFKSSLPSIAEIESQLKNLTD